MQLEPTSFGQTDPNAAASCLNWPNGYAPSAAEHHGMVAKILIRTM